MYKGIGLAALVLDYCRGRSLEEAVYIVAHKEASAVEICLILIFCRTPGLRYCGIKGRIYLSVSQGAFDSTVLIKSFRKNESNRAARQIKRLVRER